MSTNAMMGSAIPESDQSFSKAVLISVGAHVILVLVFTIKAVFMSGPPMVLENAIRVDLVALPDKIKENTVAAVVPAPAPAPAPVPEKAKPVEKKPAPEPAVNLEQNKKKETDAFKKLQQKSKESAALDKLKSELETEKRLKAAATFKGNQLSSGSELKGLTALQHENYVASIKKQIYSHWALPQWMSQKNLRAQVLMKVDEQGNVVSRKITLSSGDSGFDDMVMDAVKRSSPVPAPPEAFVRILANEGVLIGFPE